MEQTGFGPHRHLLLRIGTLNWSDMLGIVEMRQDRTVGETGEEDKPAKGGDVIRTVVPTQRRGHSGRICHGVLDTHCI